MEPTVTISLSEYNHLLAYKSAVRERKTISHSMYMGSISFDERIYLEGDSEKGAKAIGIIKDLENKIKTLQEKPNQSLFKRLFKL